MNTKIASALKLLLELVSSGVEFPDAEYKVSKAFTLSYAELREVIDAYDNQ